MIIHIIIVNINNNIDYDNNNNINYCNNNNIKNIILTVLIL